MLTCRNCGAVARLYGHDALCDACRWDKWKRQRERLDEIEETKKRHPAGKSNARFYKWHTHNPLCGCGWAD